MFIVTGGAGLIGIDHPDVVIHAELSQLRSITEIVVDQIRGVAFCCR